MIRFFLGKHSSRPDAPLDQRVWYFPSRTGRKVQSLGKMEGTARRLEALYALRNSSTPRLLVTSALALMERIPLPEHLLKHTEYRVAGEEIDLKALTRRLVDCGYYGVPLVEEYGDFSRRGGVLDIYAPLYPWPLRLEFFGEELESIRLFHPVSQRSMGALEDVILLPAGEIILDEEARERARQAIYDDIEAEHLTRAAGNVWLEKLQESHQSGTFESVLSIFHERLGTLADYLEPRTVMVWSDDALVRKEINEHHWKVWRDWSDNRSTHEWKRPPEELFLEPEELQSALEPLRQVWVNSISGSANKAVRFDLDAGGHEELTLAVKSFPHKDRLLEPLARQFQKWQQERIVCFLVCHQKGQAKRMVELLKGYGVDALFSGAPFGEESYEAPAVKVMEGELEKGFLWAAERLAVVVEEEIFGRRSRRQARKSLAGVFLNSFQDLHVDDYVVHVDHGIGIYKELVHLNVRGIESDFLLIHYQDADRLYVPVDKLQKVQKYLGVEGQEPRLDKLGGKSWEAAKKKAAESAERIAEELLNLYASREVREGFRFSPPDSLFQEFETTFGYEETPDQLKAIDDVLEDMASGRPMDRLICGDVGYGKTEVALRAAFKAVSDGKQVALLVPTTILAEQHYQAFRERFEGFPVVVASLSRFKPPTQQKQVIEGLKKGAIDVVIGTHRLIQKDVEFRDLGLLIIDEEHRFGVKHKEKLKEFRVSVDVLTLTATPIPRTLHMSLAGIRDLSTIETPPQDRHSIETFVCKYDDFTIREAICRELDRKGQVFFVHNHVQSIFQMANALNRLVPEARIAVAHGQMKERELEKVMLDFIGRKIDILVCTTIIESGLDIPAANTIIINRADKFGLAQIYQLRGRVGRSTEQAYAYLLVPGEDIISRDAQKRLRALMDFSELGAGFKIALNDLQIRGGGTILGSSQSGHIAAVGYELYLELLEKTVKEMKGETSETEALDTEINVPLSAFLPDAFIPDTDQRLLAYKRLATVSGEEDVDELSSEWRDRYGPFPDSVRNLVLMAKIRLLLKRFGIVRMDGGEETFTLHFAKDTENKRVQLFFEQHKYNWKMEADRRLKIEIWGRHLPQRLARLKKILSDLEEKCRQDAAA
ncbi:transcription-repair coupling factor [Desulforhabdus sp. TSK]|uniref:transcription-repair coupling factor n=1 Tax=Desulforhabdus sp. TSK TaxID=2925014 RepID=UPI001FC83ED5|nr:transcription-repair coupling factor [Desulforhabdus sp. TSK]